MGIDICIHPEYGLYVPEIIFCNLLSGENFDDEHDARKLGGMNGMGAKLTNIFSTEFIVETCDSTRGLKYVQRSHGNMEFIDRPTITRYTGKPYTKITFKPDFARFGLKEFFSPDPPSSSTSSVTSSKSESLKSLEDETVKLIYRRMYDISSTMSIGDSSSVNVYLNGEKIEVKSFERYIDMYVMWLFINCTLVNPTFDTQTKQCLTKQSKDFQTKCVIPDEFIEKLCKTDVGIIEGAMQSATFNWIVN